MSDTETAVPPAETAAQAPPAATQASPEPNEPAMAVAEAQLPEAADAPVGGGAGQIDILLDTAVQIEVRLGGAQMPVRDVLGLAQGSVVTLDRQVGEPVDLVMRGVVFARGQLVVVGERLGVRVKEILPARS